MKGGKKKRSKKNLRPNQKNIYHPQATVKALLTKVADYYIQENHTMTDEVIGTIQHNFGWLVSYDR